ncbi:MAG: hypothetical protein UHD09_05210 [Bifidobacterium sp.]|nr:hypothetical protein [Bifidobacterium sp.]
MKRLKDFIDSLPSSTAWKVTVGCDAVCVATSATQAAIDARDGRKRDAWLHTLAAALWAAATAINVLNLRRALAEERAAQATAADDDDDELVFSTGAPESEAA